MLPLKLARATREVEATFAALSTGPTGSGTFEVRPVGCRLVAPLVAREAARRASYAVEIAEVPQEVSRTLFRNSRRSI